MYQQFDREGNTGSSARVGWNLRTLTLLGKQKRATVFRAASPSELFEYSARARNDLGILASDEVLLRMHLHNPDIFQVISYVDAISQHRI